MDFTFLNYFIQTYQDRSFSKASQSLYITQQGLSRAIRSIEAELGYTLFTRTQTGLEPTVYGDSFYAFAKNIIRDYNWALQELALIRSNQQRVLHIGIASSIHPVIRMNLLIRKFREEHADIQLSVVHESTASCETLLREGKMEVAFLIGPSDDADIQTTILYQDPLSVWLSKDHPMAGRASLKIADIVNEPMIGFSTQFRTSHLIRGLFAQCGSAPNIVITNKEPIACYQLVEQNVGFAIHPVHWNRFFAQSGTVVDVPLDEDIKWTICMATNSKKETTPDQMLFSEFVNKHYTDFLIDANKNPPA